MSHQWRRALGAQLGLLASLSCLSPGILQAQGFSQVFVAGDSLSDTGNAAAAADFLLDPTTAAPPPYAVGLCNPADVLAGLDCDVLLFEKSRVGDGAVAVEHLAAGLGLPAPEPSFHLLPQRPAPGTNYAVASAKARAGGIEDLTSQIDHLLLDHGPLLPADGIYVLIIGGNDVIDAIQAVASLLTDELSNESPTQILDAAVAAIASSVERLVDSGARNVLVVNAPNISALPAVRDAIDNGLLRIVGRRLAALVVRAFNARLWWAIGQAQHRQPAAQIETFDLHTAFEIERARALFSGRNYRDACFDSKRYFDTAVRVFDEDCAPDAGSLQPKFDEFVFWDSIHPTGRIHAEIGKELVETVRDVFGAS